MSVILIVEDEADLQQVLAYNLRQAGHDVLTVSSGEAALAMIRQRLPDLVVLDLMLPGMTGIEVCRVIKSDPTMRQVAVLILTAKGAEIDRVVGFELGADDYVVKPFSVRELALRVQAILRRSHDPAPSESARSVEFGKLRIDRDAHRRHPRQTPARKARRSRRLHRDRPRRRLPLQRHPRHSTRLGVASHDWSDCLWRAPLWRSVSGQGEERRHVPRPLAGPYAPAALAPSSALASAGRPAERASTRVRRRCRLSSPCPTPLTCRYARLDVQPSNAAANARPAIHRARSCPADARASRLDTGSRTGARGVRNFHSWISPARSPRPGPPRRGPG
jgi:DNA-binding response OmpR family regulator